jgi:hypothetical protein
MTLGAPQRQFLEFLHFLHFLLTVFVPRDGSISAP